MKTRKNVVTKMKRNKHKRENLCSFLTNFLQKQKEKQRVLYLPFIEDEDLEDDADEDDFEPGMDMSTLLGFYQRSMIQR